jgi:uncharacterized membrane protein SpoIIM required for sporulation
MRETKFIEQNKDKWAEYEAMLQNGSNEPERLNDLFVQITDDLSYARTFYPNRSVKVYLNQLAQRIFHQVYKGRRFPASRLARFWTHDVPQAFWESRRAIALSFALFLLAFSVGVVSSVINPDFARVILGDDYVRMTLANIEKGDPMAVYKDHQPLGSAMGIAANNLFVALRTAVVGVLASIGTAFLLIYNGIMVGAFQFFFIEKGLFLQSFLTIWIHGTLEISAIVMAGASGLMAGSGLLFPGTYTRTQAFQISMRKAMKIFIGIAPLIVLAALFEGFLTRFTEVPDVLRALFIIANAAFVIWYFAVLPWIKAKKGDFSATDKDADLPPDNVQPIVFTAIKTTGEIISEAFGAIKRNLRWTFVGVLAAAGLHTFVTIGFPSTGEVRDFNPFERRFMSIDDGFVQTFIGSGATDWVTISVFLWLWLVANVAFRLLVNEMPPDLRPLSLMQRIVRTLVVLLPIFVVLWFTEWLFSGSRTLTILLRTVFLMPVLTMPFALLGYWTASIRFGMGNPFEGLLHMGQLLRKATPYLLSLFLVGLAQLFFLAFKSEVFRFFLEFFSWAIPPGEDHVAQFAHVATIFFQSIVFFFTWLMLVVAGSLHYFSYSEQTSASQLLHQIENVGNVRQIRGIPKE